MGPLNLYILMPMLICMIALRAIRIHMPAPLQGSWEEELVTKITQFGVRTLSDHQRQQAEKFGVNIIEMKDFDLGKLPEFHKPLYLSVDMDALDPAFAPGVSHHEPGGLSTRQLLGLIQGLQSQILGADLVEYNPTRDINNMTAMVCAKLLKEIASKMLEKSTH